MSILSDVKWLNAILTIFSNTNLEKADFTSAYHFIIDPRTNRVKNARFSQNGLEGLIACFGVLVE